MDYSVLTWGSSDAGGYSGAERAQLFGVFEGVRELRLQGLRHFQSSIKKVSFLAKTDFTSKKY